MDADRASFTALGTALMRDVHHRCDRPLLVDDPFAAHLVLPAEREAVFERVLLTLTPAERTAVAAAADRATALDRAVHATPSYGGVLVRVAWAERHLEAAVARGTRQYV